MFPSVLPYLLYQSAVKHSTVLGDVSRGALGLDPRCALWRYARWLVPWYRWDYLIARGIAIEGWGPGDPRRRRRERGVEPHMCTAGYEIISSFVVSSLAMICKWARETLFELCKAGLHCSPLSRSYRSHLSLHTILESRKIKLRNATMATTFPFPQTKVFVKKRSPDPVVAVYTMIKTKRNA